MAHLRKFIYCVLLFMFPVGVHAEDLCTSQKQTATERMICASPGLVWDDRSLNALYRLARVIEPLMKSKIVADQKHWLIETRNRCENTECLVGAYQSRNTALRRYINSIAEPMSAASKWTRSFAPVPNPGNCGDSFEVNFARQNSGQVIGIWEATIFCGTFINGGMVDVHEDGRIFDVRILGGRGPSHHVGVALLARKGKRLYVVNMFDRSSIGAQGDYEFFDDNVLRGASSNESIMRNDYGSTSVDDLKSAWYETVQAALSQNICTPGQDPDICIRKNRP